MNWWRASKRPEEVGPGPEPYRDPAKESVPPKKEDRLLGLQRSVGNQSVQKMLPSEGEPVPQEERQKLEGAFATGLGEVRIHRDQEAADLAGAWGASAFTAGRDIYFAPGAYGPATLAHEVSHVIQQAQATSYSTDEDAVLEREALTASSAVMSGQMAEVGGAAVAPGLQRQPLPGAQPPSLTLLPTYSLTLDNFSTDKFELSSDHKNKLDDFAKRLKTSLSRSPDTVITVVGFADAPGTEPHNLALGQQRADAVRGYLVEKGLPANALPAFSLGEQVPVIETKGHEARNRRVDIDVVERNFFRPSLALTPPTTLQTPSAAQPKLDLKVHPETHQPTPSEEFQDKLRQIDKAVREAEKARPGTSVAGLFGRVAREAAKKLGLPKWVQDRAESLARDVPSKGAQAVFDQIAGDQNLDPSTKNAVRAVIDALMRTEIK